MIKKPNLAKNEERGGRGRLVSFWVVLLGLAALICFTREPLATASADRPRELLAPPVDIQYFTFGHKEILADLFWIRSIQDFNYCEKKIAEQICKGNSWLYQMLNVITDLSPYFRMAYSAGAMALTVIISDISGASKFFDKAVAHYPDDWVILYKAAYHAIYEEKDNAKAADLMQRAAQNGSPDWVFALAGRLYSEAGRLEMAERLAQELEKAGGDPQVVKAIRERVKERQ